MPLTNTACQNAKPAEKTRRLFDGGGLYLEITPAGGKYWRMKYRYGGKEKRLSFGVYPAVSLAEARTKREKTKTALARGIDPAEAKKQSHIEDTRPTFEETAREWLSKQTWSHKHRVTVLSRLEANIFPDLGARPIADITPKDLLSTLRRMEERGALDLAIRMRQICGQIFRYGIATGVAERDIAADLKGALKTQKVQHHKILTEAELSELLARLEVYDGSVITALALKFTLHTFVRTKEIRGALWSEIDEKKAEWRIPAERMKMRRPHIVPLSSQALALLEELRPLTGRSEWIFPGSPPIKPMSENTMLYALYRLGYHSRLTVHGFRGTASTILNEHEFPPDVIERQLAHIEGNSVRASYNHAQYLPQRREMMQWWGDYLEGLQNKG